MEVRTLVIAEVLSPMLIYWALAGISRLPQSFGPLVEGAITMNRRIDRVQPSLVQRTVTLQSKNNGTGDIDSTTHDYVLFAVPFSAMRH